MNDIVKYGALAAAGYFLYQNFKGTPATSTSSTTQQQTPNKTETEKTQTPAVVVPTEAGLKRAAANAAWIGEAGNAVLNWHQWNWYRHEYSAVLATPAPEDVGMGDGSQRITARQYHDALKAAGLAGLTLGVLRGRF